MDDIFVYVTRSSIQYVLSVLNSFYDDIKLTYEQGNNNGQPDSLIISFLDVLFIRDNKKISTTVFRTDTHTHTHTLGVILTSKMETKDTKIIKW